MSIKDHRSSSFECQLKITDLPAPKGELQFNNKPLTAIAKCAGSHLQFRGGHFLSDIQNIDSFFQKTKTEDFKSYDI